MALNAESVYAKIAALHETLAKLPAKQKEGTVTPHFAKELNELLELAKEVAPNVDKRLWPTPLTIEGPHVHKRYAEVEAYLNAMMSMVPHQQYG